MFQSFYTGAGFNNIELLVLDLVKVQIVNIWYKVALKM